jgi:hypothetical protein
MMGCVGLPTIPTPVAKRAEVPRKRKEKQRGVVEDVFGHEKVEHPWTPEVQPVGIRYMTILL